MIKLPRLTPLVHLVDPKTGISTRQGADFWNQAMTRIEAALSGVQQGDVSVTDTLHIGKNLTLNAGGTLSASAGGTSVDVGNGESLIVSALSRLELLGDVTLTARPGSEADAYFPPLQVDGFDLAGDALTFSTIHDITMEGNAYLSGSDGIPQLAAIGFGGTATVAANAGDSVIIWDYDGTSVNVPNATISRIDSINIGSGYLNDLYFGSYTVSGTSKVTIVSADDDTQAFIATGAASVGSTFHGLIGAGTAASTISIPVQEGRFYVSVSDSITTNNLTVSSSTGFDTSIVSTLSQGGSRPVVLGTDVLEPGTITLTITSDGTGLSTAACYLGLVLSAPNNTDTDHITISVPPLTVWNNGTEISTNLHTLASGNGISITGDANDATVASFLSIGSQLVEQSLALGTGISISGTPPLGGTLSNSGVLAIAQGSLAKTGTIDLGVGLGLSGQTVSNAGVLALGSLAGTIELGSGLSLSGTTLENIGVIDLLQGTLSASGNVTIGAGLTLSGTTNPTLSSGGGLLAQVGTTTQLVGTLEAGSNISFSGTSPNLTISASPTVSSNIVIENSGTSIGTVGTINAGSNITALVSGAVATFSASGGGGGTSPYTAPTLSNFTALTVTSPWNGTFTQKSSYVLMDSGTQNGGAALLDNGNVWTSGKTYTLTIAATTPMYNNNYVGFRAIVTKSNSSFASSTTVNGGPQAQNAGGSTLDFDVTIGGSNTNFAGLLGSGVLWVRLRLTGTKYYFDVSADGNSWTNITSGTLPSGIAAGDTLYGGILMFNTQSGSAVEWQSSWLSYLVTVV